MKTALIAALMLAVSTPAFAQSQAERQASIQTNIARMQQLEIDYSTCVRDNAVRMGKGVKRRSKLTPDRRPILTPLASVPGPAARRVAVS